MDCNKISAHISSFNCELSQIKIIDEIVLSQINDVKINGVMQRDDSEIACFTTSVKNQEQEN